MNFNQIFNFLFINSKINTLLLCSKQKEIQSFFYLPKDLLNEGLEAKSIYKKQIRRYLGFGFFLSFIPVTEPFLARQNLLKVITKIESNIDERGDTFLSFGKSSPLYIVTRLLIKHDTTLQYIRQKKFKEILLGETGINRLNPLFYLGYLIGGLILLSGLLFQKYLPHHARDYVYPPLLMILTVVGGSYAILYLLTELILNGLHTLLVEPFIFVYEVIHQLVTHWSVEFAYTPTEDYLKVNNMLVSMGNNQLDSGKSYSTKKLTLIETTEEEIYFYKKHHESFFFKFYKDTNLFNKDPERIAKSYSLIENLFRFTCFSENELPKDLIQYTAITCFKLDSLDIETEEELSFSEEDCTTVRSTFH